jgi:hypothetical protein
MDPITRWPMVGTDTGSFYLHSTTGEEKQQREKIVLQHRRTQNKKHCKPNCQIFYVYYSAEDQAKRFYAFLSIFSNEILT